MKIENLIRDKYKNLNETEKEILRYIISNSNKIRGLRIKDLADAVFCSPNTIVRMSKKMGFTGFSEMKHVIFEELEKNFSQVPISEDGLYKDLLKTKELINSELLDYLAALIVKKKNISIFGLGPSRLSADIFSMRLTFLGIAAISFIDQHAMLFYANKIKENDICLFISFSGEQKGILGPAVIAKGRKGVIISLTGLSDNELSRIADHSMFFKTTSMYYDGADITSRVPADMVLDYLFSKMVLIMKDEDRLTSEEPEFMKY